MYRIGQAELKRIEGLFESGNIFRYGMGGECDRFEKAWARHIGVDHCRLSRSGTAALHTALVGMGIGPGDQVIVPSTYMATALAVLTAGTIFTDVDDSLTLCPKSKAYHPSCGPSFRCTFGYL